jgi:hypothetical protein
MSDDRVTETWTYAGIRLGKGNKKVHAWQDATGELMHFGRLTASAIGGRYRVNVERSADGAFQSVSRSTTFTGDRCDDAAMVGKWQTETRLAEVELTRDRTERKLKAEADAFEVAMAPLRELYKSSSSRTWTSRTAFIAMVIDAL